MPVPQLSNRAARRLFLDRHLLLRRGSGTGRGADLAQVMDQLGFVQVDSVNTLARAHDLILWSRRTSYRPEALASLISRARGAFEHWTHDASVIPMQFYPMWHLKFARDEARMRQRWTKWRSEGWDSQLGTVLDHIDQHGPVTVADVGQDEPRSSGGWWDWHPSKAALEFLWRSGRLAIRQREGFRKVYDLAERVIPSQHLSTPPDVDAVIDWAMSAALDRLGFGTSGELAAFFEIATRDEAKLWCASALAAGRIVEVDIELADGSYRRSYSTQALLDSLATLPEPSPRLRLLSPFDPALRDRNRAERLFGFFYRIEIFVPAAKRQYGYYVFPVLQGDQMVGRIDARREAGALRVTAFWPEKGQRMGAARLKALHAELERLASFTNSTDILYAADWLRTAQPPKLP